MKLPLVDFSCPANILYKYMYVFTNDLVDRGSIPGRVIPKTQKNGTRCHFA